MGAPANKTKLSPKQQLFIEHIAAGKHQSEAYSLAGYTTTTRNALDSKASQLVRNPKVSKALKALRAKLAKKAEIKSVEIIQELKAMALSNITDVVEWDMKGKTTVKPSEELKPSVKSAIKKIKSKSRHYLGNEDNPGYEEHEIEIEMHTKEGPLKLLGEYLNIWKEAKGDTFVFNQFMGEFSQKYGIIDSNNANNRNDQYSSNKGVLSLVSPCAGDKEK